MIFSALNILTNEVEELFDDSKHTKEEYENFRNKYKSAKGYCIASKKEIKAE